MSATLLEVGQTWVADGWHKTIVKFNPATITIRVQTFPNGRRGNDYESYVYNRTFQAWLGRTGATLQQRSDK
jgi:hypothetical protein